MSEANAATFRSAIDELWNQKDPTAIDRYVAEDFVSRNPDGDFVGRRAFADLYATYSAAFPDLQITVHQVLTDGDQLAAHFVFSGTHRGEFMGIAPSGNAVTVHGLSIQRWADGKVVEERAVWDSHTMMQQVGAV